MPKEEKLELTWVGKDECKKVAFIPTDKQMKHVVGEGIDEESTQNLLIEGDNLDAMKCLLETHIGKIDMIYIDPPYNTKKDFIYSDKWKRNRQEDNHSGWLCMMYPRLQLMKQLLKMGGVICVSIGDTEVANLRLLMDEIFGEDNFVRCFTWVKKDKTSGVPPTTNILPNFEYVLCYKTNGLVKAKGQSKSLKSYKQQEDGTYVRNMPIQATGSQDNYFNITDPKTGFSYYGNWAFTASTIADMIDTNRIIFPKKRDGKPTQLVTATELDLSCIFAHLGKHDSEMATKNFSSSFDNTKVFDFPKPLSLLEFLIEQLADQTNAVILDCFAGSGTTGHAVMKLNAEDGGQRQYICVQIPEKLDPKNKNQATACDFLDGIQKPRTIAEITKERLRRAGAKIRQEHPDFQGDLGFKVFKLSGV